MDQHYVRMECVKLALTIPSERTGATQTPADWIVQQAAILETYILQSAKATP